MREEDRLYDDLGWKRLRPGWAKIEIVLGLAAAAVGSIAALRPPEALAGTMGMVAGVVLMVLGGYLEMAGHRSHLYQSQNRLAAWIVSQRERG